MYSEEYGSSYEWFALNSLVLLYSKEYGSYRYEWFALDSLVLMYSEEYGSSYEWFA